MVRSPKKKGQDLAWKSAEYHETNIRRVREGFGLDLERVGKGLTADEFEKITTEYYQHKHETWEPWSDWLDGQETDVEHIADAMNSVTVADQAQDKSSTDQSEKNGLLHSDLLSSEHGSHGSSAVKSADCEVKCTPEQFAQIKQYWGNFCVNMAELRQNEEKYKEGKEFWKKYDAQWDHPNPFKEDNQEQYRQFTMAQARATAFTKKP